MVGLASAPRSAWNSLCAAWVVWLRLHSAGSVPRQDMAAAQTPHTRARYAAPHRAASATHNSRTLTRSPKHTGTAL
eukprot:3688094-Rhodomonas_salina.1